MVKFQKRRYVFVLIATIIIFSLGIMMSWIVNEKKIDIIQDLGEEQKMDDLSMQLQFLFLNSINFNETESCNVMKLALEDSWVKLTSAYTKFVKYKDTPNVNSEKVKTLERGNLLNNVRYWFLLQRAKKFCQLDDSVSTLFFFSDKSCNKCRDQSTILEYFKKLFGDRFLLFHINVDLEEPMVKILKGKYNITTSPSVVIEDEKFEGFQSKEELHKIICSKFRTEQPECKN